MRPFRLGIGGFVNMCVVTWLYTGPVDDLQIVTWTSVCLKTMES